MENEKIKASKKQLFALNLVLESDITAYEISKETKISQATIGNYRNKKKTPTPANAEILIDFFTKRGNVKQISDIQDSKFIGEMHGGSVTVHESISKDDMISMMEDRFQHLLKKDNDLTKKDEDIKDIFDENRKMTDTLLEEYKKASGELVRLNNNIKELTDRNNFLTDELISIMKKLMENKY